MATLCNGSEIRVIRYSTYDFQLSFKKAVYKSYNIVDLGFVSSSDVVGVVGVVDVVAVILCISYLLLRYKNIKKYIGNNIEKIHINLFFIIFYYCFVV
jgi:hypothetical protein